MPEQLDIKKWRMLRGYTQQEVADILGVSAKTVGFWEKESTILSNVTVYALAKLYNVDIDQIRV
ncbi:TPA: helix-turn-helix transcriptional regulator [Staphylococcus pseudintermedius]|uniref:helix-turn-helix transcriptional regulator n=1 Tax=Staphylococcus coagulans TaxID=74706 RepID=UPI0019F5D6C3|nr:XRE family transcriptional regulator [Staphylococcus pseudintermedius]EHT1768981.1 helix-turn-helix transcriptional regulator [Staphylococcus pseudintermedius]